MSQKVSQNFAVFVPEKCHLSQKNSQKIPEWPYMSKTDHEYDIVDIDTSTLWRYRRYRYDIDTYFDDIVDIDKVLSTSIQAHCDDIVDIDRFRRYRYYPTVDELKVQLWWLYVYPHLKAGSNFGQADKNKTIV